MGRAEDLFAMLELQGRAYVDELIATRKSEEAFLDFKRSANDGSGARLDAKDRDNFAKCLSGFANSEGGVILWGVVARDAEGADTASGHRYLADAPRFAAQLDAVLSGLTVPPVVGARSIPLVADGQRGFAATLIPRSHHAPHQTTQDRAFYIRAGSTFQPAMLSVLAGLFGRAPRPNVVPRFLLNQSPTFNVRNNEDGSRTDICNVTFELVLLNDSNVVASDAYAAMSVTATGGHPASSANCSDQSQEGGWVASRLGNPELSMVATPSNRLAPRGRVKVARVSASLYLPIKGPVAVTITVGAAGAPPSEVSLGNGGETLWRLVEDAHGAWQNESRRAAFDWRGFVASVFNFPSGSILSS